MIFHTSLAFGWIRYACWLLLIAIPVLLNAQPLTLPPPSSQIANNLQTIWDNEVNIFDAEGGIISVYVPGLWTWEGATGNARISPSITASPDFSYRIGSLSKSFVAAALLKLQENSVLDLDDGIGLYLDAGIF